MDACLVCHLRKPAHQWDPTADRDMCMYPIDAVPQPHWIPICYDCHSMILAIPNKAFYKIALRLARRQRRQVDMKWRWKKERIIR
ncbi:hypothetical protein ES703_101747 [subsurface metagenome]